MDFMTLSGGFGTSVPVCPLERLGGSQITSATPSWNLMLRVLGLGFRVPAPSLNWMDVHIVSKPLSSMANIVATLVAAQ